MVIHYGKTAHETAQDPDPVIGVNLDIPVLGEIRVENIPTENAHYEKKGNFHLWKNSSVLFGFTKTKEAEGKETAAALYREMFELTKGVFLYRVWNYLPDINCGEGDNERYKQFCKGRSEAFREAFGSKEFTFMPAGSCVGTTGDEVIIYFLAGTNSPDHHENPNQAPAYRYPRQYGPKAPSFARATSVQLENRRHRFISGTAAVLGHESQGIHDLHHQLNVTCDNLELISRQTLHDGKVSKIKTTSAHGKVYIRNADDYFFIRNYLKKRFPEIADSLVYLRSDICRKELLVEIELSYIDTE